MILVTGGTGLLGAHLLLHLLKKHEAIRAIYRTESNIKKTKELFVANNAVDLFEKIEWVNADLNDISALEKAFENIKKVFHCAAHVYFSTREEELLRKTNIEGTANLINLSIDRNIEKFFHVSSIAALGDPTSKDQLINETSAWNPYSSHSDYAISKYGAETEVWRGSQEGLPIIIINPGIIFGNGFWNQGSSEIFKKIHQGFPFYTKGTTGIVDVNDVCNIMIDLMDSSITNESYIVISENINYQDLLYKISDYLNKKRPSLYAFPFITGITWRLDYLISLITLKKSSYSRFTAKASHSNNIYDNSKIIKTLNYTFKTSSVFLKSIAESYLTSNH